ncbi:Quinone oxidoreductase 2 [Arthrobacter ulcerisalmonis]|uniref:Quinone oxidoreductase 2 n=1 Tax=Arthrobacter ulcerisalmonis TaxID=2483813 RepID=A0A3P5WD64_9MICC|nr:SDR family oxidoreductase [Arthrobacter ulcerisalmonis]VDC21453.1 Quinone oxidoreductase 2 [Arthrobacter ulcerisalmonis]
MSQQNEPLPALAITGSTGNLGGLVAKELAAAGMEQRLVVRDLARAPQFDGTRAVVCSYSDAAAAELALAGVDVLFMVSAAEAVDRLAQHITFIDAAARAGVAHVVYTSFVGAAADATFTLARDHFATEQHLRASGMDYTILRDNFYLDFLPQLAGDDGVIRGPGGSGAFAGVARTDVARCATAVLRDPAVHRGQTYNLTGPEDLTLAQAAVVISTATGRDIRFHEETLEEAYASRASYNAEPWQLDAWVSTYTAMGSGELGGVSPDVHGLTGHDPLSLADVLAQPVL